MGVDANGQQLVTPKDCHNWVAVADAIFNILAASKDKHIVDPHQCNFFLLALLINELTDQNVG